MKTLIPNTQPTSIRQSAVYRLPRLLILSACAFLHWPGRAAPGDLDPSFSNGGAVSISIGSGLSIAHGVALQSDGKIVVVGAYSPYSPYNEFALARLNTDGTLDSSFGSGGTVTTAFTVDGAVAISVAVQSDGKIVAAGYAREPGHSVFALARYNAEGTLDSGFGGDGKVTTSFGSSSSASANSVAVQSDGKIVAAGYGANGRFAVARYNTDGTLDTSFGGDGKVITPEGAGGAGYGMQIQSDGKIVVAGYDTGSSDSDFMVVRFNTDGTLDSGFSNDGMAFTDFDAGEDDIGQSVAVQSDGKIVVAGYSYDGGNDFALARYNADGSHDSSFGNGGKVTTDLGSLYDGGTVSVALQGDGKILASGDFFNGNNYDFALVRYNTDGSLDSGFGSGGKVTNAFGFSSNDSANSIVVQSDGKIVVVGSSSYPNGTYFAVVRYLGGAPAIESWRQLYFGTTSNSGDAADTFDFDKDGLVNLIEFGFGLDPTQGSSLQLPPPQRIGGNCVISFAQPAGVDGITYGVEWSTTLSDNPADWTAIADSDPSPTGYTFSVPVGTNDRIFMRLKVTAP